MLQRGLDICERSPCEPPARVQGLFFLAQVLLATKGDKGRALELARKAQLEAQKRPTLKEKLSEIEHWLSAHSK